VERNSLMKMFREDRDHRNKRTRDWHKNNPVRSYLLAARGRAKRLGVPFNLKEEDIVFPKICPALGIPIILLATEEPRKRTDNTPSLDRIIPELGYTKGNVRVISWRANRLKSDAKLYEVERLLRYMKETKQQAWERHLNDDREGIQLPNWEGEES
jgi:hypothetical protein